MLLVALAVALLVSVANADAECIDVYGYSSCAYFQRAKCWVDGLDASKYTVQSHGGTRDEYQGTLTRLKNQHSGMDKQHRTSPLVLRGCGSDKTYVGGSDDLVKLLKERRVSAPAGCW